MRSAEACRRAPLALGLTAWMLAASLVPAAAWAQAPAAAAPPPAAAQAPGSLSNSVLTVEELLRLENALAAKLAQEQRVKAGLAAPEQPAAPRKTQPVSTTRVDAIFGSGDRLRAHLHVDGVPFENVEPGTRVKGCEVVRVENRCVVFRPVAKTASAALCPTACWTGVPPPPPQLAGITPGGVPPIPPGAPGMPLPMPLPAGGGAPALVMPAAPAAAAPDHAGMSAPAVPAAR